MQFERTTLVRNVEVVSRTVAVDALLLPSKSSVSQRQTCVRLNCLKQMCQFWLSNQPQFSFCRENEIGRVWRRVRSLVRMAEPDNAYLSVSVNSNFFQFPWIVL